MNLVWEDENMARHWIDRYAAGLDDAAQLDRILECVGAIYEADELDPELRPSPPAEPVAFTLECVGRVREHHTEGSPVIDWLTEGGLYDVAIGTYLCVTDAPIPSDGALIVYAAPPADRFEALLRDLEALPKSERPSKGSNGGRCVPFIRVSDLRAVLAKYKGA